MLDSIPEEAHTLTLALSNGNVGSIVLNELGETAGYFLMLLSAV